MNNSLLLHLENYAQSLPYGPGIVRERTMYSNVSVITSDEISPRSSYDNLLRVRKRALDDALELGRRMYRFYLEAEIGLEPRFRVRCPCGWRGYRRNLVACVIDDERGIRIRPCPSCKAAQSVEIVKRVPYPLSVLAGFGVFMYND